MGKLCQIDSRYDMALLGLDEDAHDFPPSLEGKTFVHLDS
jgi:hypothetical protein